MSDETEVRGVAGVVASPVFAGAYALTAIGLLFGEHLVTALIGVPGYAAAMAVLVAIGVAMLILRRDEIRLLHLLPTTLLMLLVWLLLTVFWSSGPAWTIGGWLAFAAPAVIAVVVAHTRDTVQTVRAVGDVLRVLLTASLVVEILSGILIDAPIAFLGVSGRIAEGGPIEGLFGTRTRLGLVAVLAIVTFAVEWRTRSVRRGVAIASIAVAAVLAAFTASPIVLVLAFLAALAAALLEIVRRVPRTARRRVQWTIAVSLVVGAVVVYAFRRPLVYWLNAEPEFLVRSRVWNAILDLAAVRPVQGWGWVDVWPPDLFPYSLIRFVTGQAHRTALNAGMDVLLQAGWVGVVLFAAFVLVALTRAWLSASERRSIVYTWPPLVLVVLLAESAVGTGILTGFGFFLTAVCATRVSLVRGWRLGFEGRDEPPPAELPHGSGR